MQNLCACGCKSILPDRPYETKFIKGHQSKMPKKLKVSSTSKFTGYDRSKKILTNRTKCSWSHIGHCMGMIDVCHIDQNPLNNDLKNLIALCRCHHRLLDNGRINPKNPIMPRFYIDRRGKRRYL